MTEEGSPETQDTRDEARRRAHDSERIEQLRERLYARGTNLKGVRDQGRILPRPVVQPEQPMSAPEPTPSSVDPDNVPPTTPMKRSTRSRFRTMLMVGGGVFFTIALIVSVFFLFSGNNKISGSNIAIDVFGPISVGGGEVVDLKVTLANQNALPIESSTLIVTYPPGTQSATEPGKELYTERLELNNIEPNQVVNIPLRALVFGEENDTKTITMAVEYRVRGSNAIFSKEALPFEFKISSSPVVINVNTVSSVPSGQEITLDVQVESNAQEEVSDLLVKASYPKGFDFKRATPDTASGQDTWRIPSLKPGEKKEFRITGVLTGGEGDLHQFDIAVGVPNARDTLTIASPLALRTTEVTIERPFLTVDVRVNGEDDETVIVAPNTNVNTRIAFTNALETALYDTSIRVTLSGNALNEIDIDAGQGFYDSSANTITWDSVDVEELRELAPGDDHVVTFGVRPREDVRQNPEVAFTVSVETKRVGEDRVPESIVDTVKRTVKISSGTKLGSSALYSADGPFVNSGPVPPVAEQTTEYALLFTARNGTNPVTDGEMVAVLPTYVTWLNQVSPNGAVAYNPTTRTVTWTIGDLKANEYREAWVQIALTPSLSQVGSSPTLIESQRFRATDRFTGSTVRAEAPALTTSLKNDPNSSFRDGRVQEN